MPGHALTSPAGRGLELEPFRAAYFDAGRVDLSAAVCPPYDVVEPAEDRRLRLRSPYNAVHLIRPHSPAGESRTPDAYVHAARLASQWSAQGLLRRDAAPALYVYEQVVGGRQQRGVLGGLRIRADTDRVVLPHEGVFPAPVADRLALMTATNAQLEPILVAASSPCDLAALLEEASAGPPWLRAAPPDGSVHQVWRVVDPDATAQIQDGLSGTQGLIADGHHRYAAYQRMQQQESVKRRDGSWDFGLALVVGTAADGLSLAAIHRSVRDATFADALARLDRGVTVTALPAGLAADATALLRIVDEAEATTHATPSSTSGDGRPMAAGGVVSIVLTDGREAALLGVPVAAGTLRSSLAATVSAERFVPDVFGVADDDERVGYHHDAKDAVGAAKSKPGVAVLLPAPRLADVMAIAAAGERMPRKSTSFGPKPRSGLVMRFLD